MRTWLTETFGIEHPIVGAPMFLVSGPELVAAVCEAGGLGMVPSLNGRTTEDFAAMLDEIERRTERPYGVNLVLARTDRLEADLEVCLRHRVRAVVTSLGDPTPVIEKVRPHGIKVFCDVVNMRHARKAASAGADALVAVCAGAGGHAGTVTPTVLVPLLVDTFGLPVILGGGVTDGRALAAALCLGACGAYVGTRLVATRQSLAPEAFKRAVVEADLDGVEYTDEVTGVPAWFLKSSLERLRRGEVGPEKRHKEIWSAGQGVAMVHEVADAGAVVREMARRAHEVLSACCDRSPPH